MFPAIVLYYFNFIINHLIENLHHFIRWFLKTPFDPFIQQSEKPVRIKSNLITFFCICAVLRHHIFHAACRNTGRQCSNGVNQWMDKARTVYRFSSAGRKRSGRDGSIYKIFQRGTAGVHTGISDTQTVQGNICGRTVISDCMQKIQFKCPIFVDQCIPFTYWHFLAGLLTIAGNR